MFSTEKKIKLVWLTLEVSSLWDCPSLQRAFIVLHGLKNAWGEEEEEGRDVNVLRRWTAVVGDLSLVGDENERSSACS